MKRFVRNSFILTAVILASILASVMVGRLLPPTPFERIFTYPDGRPCVVACLFGARPNTTRYEEAVSLLKQHPLTRDLLQRERIATYGMVFEGREMIVELLGHADGRLLQISLHIEPTDVQRLRLTSQGVPLPEAEVKEASLGALVARLGQPDQLLLDGVRQVELFYQNTALKAVFEGLDERVVTNGTLRSIFMYPNPIPESFSLSSWHGFLSMEHYFRLIDQQRSRRFR